jgi:hypothetical protein
LLPDLVLPFDDEEFAGCTVADVLADPDRFEGATLADPNEGPDYGHCVAKILRRPDGTPWIDSFAHGRTVYELKYDAAAVRSAIQKADKTEVVKTLLERAVVADLNAQELEELRDLAAMRSGAGKQAIKTMLKRAQKEQSAPSRSASAVPPGAPTPGRRFTTQPSMRRGCRRCKYSTTYLAHRRPKYRRRATLTTTSRGHGSSASRTRMHLQTQTPTQKSNGNANDQTAHPRTVGVIKDERNGSRRNDRAVHRLCRR